MVELDISNEERKILADALESQLSDLRMEISSTDRKDVRDQLKRRKQVLKKALDALSPAAPTG